MNRFSKFSLFPWLTLLLGAVGYCLRLWLLADLDDHSLLPVSHPAGVITVILLFVLLIFYFLVVRTLSPISQYTLLFPRSALAIAGNVAAAAGFLCGGIGKLSGSGKLGIVILALSILAAMCVLYAGYCRLKGQRCHYLARSFICFYLMLYLIISCRSWGAESQVQLYLFQLLASLFLVLASYYRTVLDAQKSDRRPYIIVTQGALFCCILCLKGDNSLYYLAMAFWMATDCCNTRPKPARYLKKK